METRNWDAGAVLAPPAVPAAPSNGYPTNGDPLAAQPATTPGAYWFHQVAEELRAVVVAGGLTPDDEVLTQLRDAIRVLALGRSVGWGEATLGSDANTTSASDTATGLQLDYTAVDGENRRVIHCWGYAKSEDNDAGHRIRLKLQWYNGAAWVDLGPQLQIATGQVNSYTEVPFSFRVVHAVDDDTPQYRLTHANIGTVDDGSTVFAGARLQIEEIDT